MATTYTIQHEDSRGWKSIYEVLADDLTGFDDFVAEHGATALPGSTIDIADYKLILRLRNDGNWEQYQDYASAEERAEIDAAALEAILDGLIPEEG
ncbi:MAG: hypothetical protein IJ960_06695 [Oscillospiraceae bacterium]|nr:hypothetical protein [Oscillospiraceae bacterium]